ncbi:hypothetical protein QVN85_12540 [Oscillibacter valericigenes]|jgi:GNAT superfamily N-acetyltransferase|nr:hypothetical protein [Oscillibacter valericigenes]
MRFWRRKRSGVKCKDYCDAYSVAYAALEKLHSRCKELTPKASNFNRIIELYAEQSVVLGISEINNHIAVTTLRNEGGRWRKVSLCFLSDTASNRPICWMEVTFNEEQQKVSIVDFQSEIENLGYGSVLMTHLISYLKLTGYQRMVGSICPADFDHEEKLRYFYSKFGFEIIDCIDRRRLKLNLKSRQELESID